MNRLQILGISKYAIPAPIKISQIINNNITNVISLNCLLCFDFIKTKIHYYTLNNKINNEKDL